jgi:methanogenic corrinoid protein MtbC1
MPALYRLGSAWHRGTVTVAGEHFVSATVHRRIATLLDATAVPPPGAPRVIVGLARGSRHELGVLAFATALRRAGLDVVYVGGDLPPESWVVSVAGEHPAAVVLGVPTLDDVPAVRETVAALAVAQPDVPVYVGGRHQDDIGAPARALGHALAAAADAASFQKTEQDYSVPWSESSGRGSQHLVRDARLRVRAGSARLSRRR